MTTTHFTAIAGAAPSLAPALSSPVVPGASKRAFWIQPTACYFQSDHALIDRAARHIGVYGVALYQALCRHADFATGEAFPTIEMLMQELGISEPTACKYLAVLEACAMITKRTTCWGSREQGPKSRNFYRVLPATKWDFSGLEKPLKSAPKEVVPQLKEIGSNKKHQNKKNEKQQTAKPRPREKPVVVLPIASDVPPSEAVAAPEETLLDCLESLGVKNTVARLLLERFDHRVIEQQIVWLPARQPRSRAAVLVKSLQENWDAPVFPRGKASPPLSEGAVWVRGDMPTPKQVATPPAKAPEVVQPDVGESEAFDESLYDRPTAKATAPQIALYVPRVREELRAGLSVEQVATMRARLAPLLEPQEWVKVIEAMQENFTPR